MKQFFAIAISFVALCAYTRHASAGAANHSASATKQVAYSTSATNAAGFTLGVQMWTFRMFTFAEALDKVDSAGINQIEAFWGQKLGSNIPGEFGIAMTPDARAQLKQLLKQKGITIVAMGVIRPNDRAEWIKTFDLAKEFNLKYITCEPIKTQWDMIDSLAGAYHIKIAIHDHPRPNAYWEPDSVLAAIKGHQNIGDCADIGHWARNGLNPVDCLKKLEGHIYGVHLKDIVTFNDTKAEDTVASKGVIDIPAVFAELKRQNFTGMMSIEHESNWYHSTPDVIFTKHYFDAQVARLGK